MANTDSFFGVLKDKKNFKFIVIALAGILLLIISGLSSSQGGGTDAEVALEEYKVRLEGELSELCSAVEGAGKCRVMITFSDGERLEYKGSQLIGSSPPSVSGVTVLCRGAGSVKVRGEITEIVSALFDIGANRICVLKLS